MVELAGDKVIGAAAKMHLGAYRLYGGVAPRHAKKSISIVLGPLVIVTEPRLCAVHHSWVQCSFQLATISFRRLILI